jgi:hypothetical protein
MFAKAVTKMDHFDRKPSSLSENLFVSSFFCASICLSVFVLLVHLYLVSPSVWLPVHLSMTFLSVRQSVHLSVYLYFCLSVQLCLSVHLCLSIFLSVCTSLSVCLARHIFITCQSLYIFDFLVCLSIFPSILPSIFPRPVFHLSVSPSVCSIHTSVCLSACLYKC